MFPDKLMCHRFQEVLGAQSCLLCLALRAHLDLLESHRAHLQQFQVPLEDLWECAVVRSCRSDRRLIHLCLFDKSKSEMSGCLEQ